MIHFFSYWLIYVVLPNNAKVVLEANSTSFRDVKAIENPKVFFQSSPTPVLVLDLLNLLQ